MTSALQYLLAARRCEIGELEQLAHTSALVGSISALVHGLQRERGLSNVVIVSGGARFVAQRQAQIAVNLAAEQAVRGAFQALESRRPYPGNGTRLFSRVASVLPGLDGLSALRRRIAALELDADRATAAYAKLVAGLIAVVFEAADGATDPDISRRLAAFFNFMQGKEYAGQERACGAAAFTAGVADETRRRRWLRLIAAQERCFDLFVEFGGPDAAEAWRGAQPAHEMAELERLRRIACASASGERLDDALGIAWFDVCTLRIDAMHAVEERLTGDLQHHCAARIAEARAEIVAHEALLTRLTDDAAAAPGQEGYYDEPGPVDPSEAPAPAGPYGALLGRSILDMLQEQQRRVQAMSDELEAVRAALNERKLVERAKGLLMARRQLSEGDAHRMLRQTAMKQNRRLVDVAESLLALADVLPDGAPDSPVRGA